MGLDMCAGIIFYLERIKQGEVYRQRLYKYHMLSEYTKPTISLYTQYKGHRE